jgi:hypothetical protein
LRSQEDRVHRRAHQEGRHEGRHHPGYADKTGDLAKNEELAKERAKAVRDVLTAAGAAEANITMKPPAFVTGGDNNEVARRVELAKSM